MTTSWHGNAFRITGPCDEISLTMRSFDFLCTSTWTSCWINSRVADDLNRHDAHASPHYSVKSHCVLTTNINIFNWHAVTSTILFNMVELLWHSQSQRSFWSKMNTDTAQNYNFNTVFPIKHMYNFPALCYVMVMPWTPSWFICFTEILEGCIFGIEAIVI